MFALARVWRRRVVAIRVTLAVLAVASFLLSWRWTATTQPWAFFSLPARAWELLTGALVAFGSERLQRIRPSTAALCSWLGLGAVVWSVFAYSSSTRFPGTAALLPVLGTVALLVGGASASRYGARLLLDRAPLQFVGRLSYAWYLWHWPIIVLAPAVVGHPLTRLQNGALAAASGVLAYGTVLLVEQPIRFAPSLATRPRCALALGAALTAAVLLAGAATTTSLPSLVGHGEAVALTPRIAVPATPDHASRDADHARPGARRARDRGDGARGTGQSRALARASRARRCRAVSRRVRRLLHRRERSPLCLRRSERSDDDRAVRRLARRNVRARIRPCREGAPLAPRRVVEVDVPAVPRPGIQPGSLVRRLRRITTHVLVLSPAPRPPGDVPGCLSAHLDDIERCAIPFGWAVPLLGFLSERKVAIAAGGEYVDITPWR
jgi:hypothetical protein